MSKFFNNFMSDFFREIIRRIQHQRIEKEQTHLAIKATESIEKLKQDAKTLERDHKIASTIIDVADKLVALEEQKPEIERGFMLGQAQTDARRKQETF